MGVGDWFAGDAGMQPVLVHPFLLSPGMRSANNRGRVLVFHGGDMKSMISGEGETIKVTLTASGHGGLEVGQCCCQRTYMPCGPEACGWEKPGCLYGGGVACPRSPSS